MDNGFRILVVADAAAPFTLPADVVATHGYQPLYAASGAEGLALLEREAADLLLVAAQLPDMEGSELCRRLRAQPASAALPVLLISNGGRAGERQQGLDAGADDVLFAPIDAADLLPRLRPLLRRGLRQRELAAAHAESRQSAQLFRSLLESAPDGMLISDRDGRITFLNAQAEALFGYPREELLGQPVDLLVPERVRAAHHHHRQGYSQHPEVRTMGTRRGMAARRRDGSEFPADVSLASPDGRQVIAVVRDVSERVRTEEELQRSNRTLRMLSLCNETLVRAQDEAELRTAICRHLVDSGGYHVAWVGLAISDHGGGLWPAACAGATDDYMTRLRIGWAEGENVCAPSCAALREGRAAIVRHLAQEPTCELPGDSAPAACLALPLAGRDGLLGTLTIHSADAQAFDAGETALLQELASNLAHGIHSLRETAARQRFEQELEYQTNYDRLTGLPNRSLFVDRLRQSIVHAGRAERVAAVLVVDLDRFKVIRDSLGHAAADEVLKHAGRQLAASLRQGDTVARLSADEFAVVLSDVLRTDDVAPVAGKLLDAVAQPLELGGQAVHCSASIGISLYPQDGESADALLGNAEAASYNAKGAGGQTFRFYAPDMNEGLAARLALETELRRALEREELVLHFQPRVHLASGRIVGAEALVRWQHPQRGLLPPLEFIPVAEESGIILPLGTWVIDRTCRQIRAWLDAGLVVPVVAVNLSARQFHEENLARTIRQALDAHHLEAKYLELEITEGTAMRDLEATQATLRALKEIGLKLSLDDFGTGYSSLAYLKRFPIDHLKIDRTFVRDLTTDPDDAAICIAVISLAHALKLTVIAEGAESAGQVNYLRQHGCDEVQGYHFSRPLPAAEFALLAAGWLASRFAPASDEQPTLLVVDDEAAILRTLQRALRQEGYRILTAGSAREGFDVLANHRVQVILSDQRMPEMSGTEFLSRARDLYPDTVRMVLSGYTELKSVTDAINHGAIYKFLTKPWEDAQLRQEIRAAFRQQRSVTGKAGKDSLP